MSAALREIVAHFGVDFETKELAKGDNLISGMVGKLKGFAVGLAGAFAVDKVVDFTNSLLHQADAIGDTSEQIGVSTRQLQEWGYIAKLNGAEAEDYTAAVRRLGAQLAEASTGKGSAQTFKRLGVSLKDARGELRPTGDVFEDVAVAISKLDNPTEQAGVAADLFGKQYARLLPMFRRGADGLAVLRKEFAELGGGFSDDFVKNAGAWEDGVDRLKLAGTSLASQVIGPLLPILTDLAREGLAFIRSLTDQSHGSTYISEFAHAVTNILKVMTRLNVQTSFFSKLSRWVGIAVRALSPLYIALLGIEDVLVFLAGGKSLLGKKLDDWFGAGTAQKIQQFFAFMVQGFGATAAEISAARATAIEFGTAVLIQAEKMRFALLQIPLQVGVAFQDLWNSIVDGATDAVLRLGDLVSKIPGAGDLGKEFGKLAVDLHMNARSTGASADLAALQTARAAALEKLSSLGQGAADLVRGDGRQPALTGAAAQAQADALLALAKSISAAQPHAMAPQVAAAPGSAPPTFLLEGIKQAVNVNVTVPPGTNADLARRVGDAAGSGAAKGIDLRGAKIAVGG